MSTSEFDAFWAQFPRREKKQAARDAFAWAMKKHNGDGQLLTRILATITWQRVLQPNPQYWQQADKWLLGMRWEDEKPITEGEQREMESFLAWKQANAENPDVKTVSFDMFQRYQRGIRRAG